MKKEIVMCPPKYIAARIPNNKWMKDIPEEKRQIDRDRAMKQFMDIYSLFAQDALVWLIPPRPRLQDQVYVSNVAVILPHLKKTAILAKFRAEGRPGEEDAAYQLLEPLGYECYFSPYYFEGEAELKYLHDNVFIGGYGIRTELKALDWLENEFDCKIIKVENKDPYLYHLDCSIFPLNDEIVLAYEGIPKEAYRKIEREATVIPVTKEEAYAGICNSVRIGYVLYNGNQLPSLTPGTDAYRWEILKNRKLEEICYKYGLELVYVDLSEFIKSGALLSCMVLHLTHDKVKLT